MRISEQFIASLLSRIDLVELIGNKVNLRQTGANFIGLCPFHKEKTPSFTVNKNKQFFHCFGCKESGDAIKFLMLTENKSFLDSVEVLATQYGMQLEKHPTKANPLVDKIYQILQLAADFYQQQLLSNAVPNSQAVAAMDYLTTKRGINLTTIRTFGIGFADFAWTKLFDFFQQQVITSDLAANVEELKDLLQKSGLLLEKNGKFYDRFRGRVIFPIRNKFNQVIGFGARSLKSTEQPKYLNSPETLVFSKQKELYGLEQIKKNLKNIKSLIIVEGYLDVLTLYQAKIENVVATLGTAVNENHIKNMLSVSSEIYFCFDGDMAGEKAATKAMECIINLINSKVITSKHIIKFILLPKNYDPDLLVKQQGADQFNKIVLAAKPLSDFFFDNLLKKYPEKNIENLNQLAQEAKGQIAKLTDNLLRNLWYEKLAGILGVDSNILKIDQQLNSNITHQSNYNSKQYPSKISHKSPKTRSFNYSNRNHPIPNAIRALSMLLIKPNLLKWCKDIDGIKFNLEQLPSDLNLFMAVRVALQDYLLSEQFSTEYSVIMEQLVNYLEPVHAQKLSLIKAEKIVQFIPASGMEQEFIGAVKHIKRELLEHSVESLLKDSKTRPLKLEEKVLLQKMLQAL